MREDEKIICKIMSEKSKSSCIQVFYYVGKDNQVISETVTPALYTLRRQRKHELENLKFMNRSKNDKKKVSFTVNGDIMQYLEEIVKQRKLPDDLEVETIDPPKNSVPIIEPVNNSFNYCMQFPMQRVLFIPPLKTPVIQQQQI